MITFGELLDGAKIKIDVAFGGSNTDKPKRICPKCKSNKVIYNGLVKSYNCECGNEWVEK